MSNPSFTYTPNVPQAEQKISATQEPILNNFQAINDFFVQNHVGFIDPINYGKHTFTTFPFQSSDPSTDSAEMALYSKATGSGPNPGELFYRYPSDGTVVQMTPIGTGSGENVPNFCYLAEGLVMFWGIANNLSAGTTNIINLPTGINIPTLSTGILCVDVSPFISGTYTLYVSDTTLTSFTVFTYVSSLSWMVIGS